MTAVMDKKMYEHKYNGAWLWRSGLAAVSSGLITAYLRLTDGAEHFIVDARARAISDSRSHLWASVEDRG